MCYYRFVAHTKLMFTVEQLRVHIRVTLLYMKKCTEKDAVSLSDVRLEKLRNGNLHNFSRLVAIPSFFILFKVDIFFLYV